MHNEYLDILGLQRGATKKEIKSAYRRLAKRYHPDVSKDEDARANFIKITEAYKFLIVAGPYPNDEQVRYNYNPHQQRYDYWREQAKAYARKKAAEAALYEQNLLRKIYSYFNFINVIILAFNVAILVDFLLPSISHIQRVMSVSEIYYRKNPQSGVVHLYDIVVFENFQLRVERSTSSGLADNRALVHTTPVLNIITHADIQLKDEIREIKPAYGIYYLFRFLVPLGVLFSIVYYLLHYRHVNKISVVVVAGAVFLIELVMILTFSY